MKKTGHASLRSTERFDFNYFNFCCEVTVDILSVTKSMAPPRPSKSPRAPKKAPAKPKRKSPAITSSDEEDTEDDDAARRSKAKKPTGKAKQPETPDSSEASEDEDAARPAKQARKAKKKHISSDDDDELQGTLRGHFTGEDPLIAMERVAGNFTAMLRTAAPNHRANVLDQYIGTAELPHIPYPWIDHCRGGFETEETKLAWSQIGSWIAGFPSNTKLAIELHMMHVHNFARKLSEKDLARAEKNGFAKLKTSTAPAPLGIHALLAPVFTVAAAMAIRGHQGTATLRQLAPIVVARSSAPGIGRLLAQPLRDEDDKRPVQDLAELFGGWPQRPALPSSVTDAAKVTAPSPAGPSQRHRARNEGPNGRGKPTADRSKRILAKRASPADVVCHKCHQKGHYMKDCTAAVVKKQ